MAKNVVLILEYGDGGYSCYNDEPLGNYGVIDGDGATAEEAKADFMKALQECRDDDPNNKDLQDLTFTYKYDVQAFFKEFSFLNATEIARRAGINPSLMRQYVSGVKTAGEKTYQRLNACMGNIKADLQGAFLFPNVKSYLIIHFFVVVILKIRKLVVSLQCLKRIMI